MSARLRVVVTLAVVAVAGAESPPAKQHSPSNASSGASKLALAASAGAEAPPAKQHPPSNVSLGASKLTPAASAGAEAPPAKQHPPCNASLGAAKLLARGGRCTQSQCSGAVSIGTSVCTAASTVLGVASLGILSPLTSTLATTGCTLFKTPEFVSATCGKLCGPDAPEPLPDWSVVTDAMDKNTLKQQGWYESLNAQTQALLAGQQELREGQVRIQAQVAENARLIQQSYQDLSGKLTEIQRQLAVMSYFDHYNSQAMKPVEDCLGIFLSYADNADGYLGDIYKQDLVNCAWRLGNEKYGPVKELAAMMTVGNTQAATYAGSIWDIGTSQDNRAFCAETPRKYYMEFLPTAAFLRSAALVFIQEGMRPTQSARLRGAAAEAAARSGSLDTQEGVKKWLEATMEQVYSEFSARCPPGEWQVQFHFPPAWWNVHWDLSTLEALGSGGKAMAISPSSADGWSPAPEGHGPEKALDGNSKTSYRLPGVSDGYRAMDKTMFQIGGTIQEVDGTKEDWTHLNCMEWCNERDECGGFEYADGYGDDHLPLGPHGEIRTGISFVGAKWAQTEGSDLFRAFVKVHPYGGGMKMAQFAIRENWRNGAPEVPEFIVAAAQSPEQPKDSPVLMVVRYRGRDGRTLVPTPLVAQAPLDTRRTGFYTACYNDAPWPKAGCEKDQCFVRDWSSRGHTIAGADRVVSDAGACQKRCQNYPGCTYWTFYGNAKGEVENNCCLKTQAAEVFTLQVGSVSGPVKCAVKP